LTWLIAEDEPDIRNLIALMCQAWGHTPLTFENGQKVWDWLDLVERGQQAQLPELILMDIRMPGKKGNEIAHRMRSIAQLQPIPIVLMTAYTLNERERQEMMINDGVDKILNKPLPDFDQLRTILHNTVDEKQASESAKADVSTTVDVINK
jgi:CheY-like chemotaxis protein